MSLRLTPLNITLACVLAWYITDYNSEIVQSISWVWLLVFLIFISIVDILFRMRYRSMARLWIMQVGFLLVVSILFILIKLQF